MSEYVNCIPPSSDINLHYPTKFKFLIFYLMKRCLCRVFWHADSKNDIEICPSRPVFYIKRYTKMSKKVILK
jgi:hypothetical protein